MLYKYLGKLEADFVNELLAFFPLFGFVNVNNESSIPVLEIKITYSKENQTVKIYELYQFQKNLW